MSFGFPAYYVEKISGIDASVPLLKVVRYAVNSLDWTIETDSEGIIIAKIGFNIWSWGERVEIDFFMQDEITIKSSCVRFTQCIDWGKNKRNVKKFVAVVRKRITEMHR